MDRLGHYPKHFKTTPTDKERAENSLAKTICTRWSKLSDTTKAKLTRFQQETQDKDAELEQQVEQLGHYPKRFKTPTTDKERAENSFADAICKQWSKLSDATKAKLTRLQQQTQGRDAEKQAERRAEEILERLRALSKWPKCRVLESSTRPLRQELMSCIGDGCASEKPKPRTEDEMQPRHGPCVCELC